MTRYVLQRAAQAVALLALVSLVGYAIMNLAPGGPLAVYMHNPQVTPERIAILRHQLGFDRPWYARYVVWAGALLRGQWGDSYYTGRPVLAMIGERLPATLALMLSAFGLAIALAIPLGTFAATHKYSWGDTALSFGSFFAWAMPTFWFGLMLQLLFAVRWRLLPVAGMHEVGNASLPDLARLLDVLSQDYVRTARAKGFPEARVRRRHMLRNALIPIATLIGLDLHALVGGAVITESIFGWPGMGRLFLEALNNRDYPVQMAGLMMSAALLVAGNLMADLAYVALDPRIRYQ